MDLADVNQVACLCCLHQLERGDVVDQMRNRPDTTILQTHTLHEEGVCAQTDIH